MTGDTRDDDGPTRQYSPHEQALAHYGHLNVILGGLRRNPALADYHELLIDALDRLHRLGALLLRQ